MSRSYHREFRSIVKGLSYRHAAWQVFADFCELAALSLSNALCYDDERERRYLNTVSRYSKDEANAFASLLGVTTLALEVLNNDFLGENFMALDLGSHWCGQYFTPFPICQMMVGMTKGNYHDAIAQSGYVSVHEPCVGSGAMIIAFARSMLDQHINFQQALHVTAIDVSPTAAHMAFVQLSLLHIPAVVCVGNTLSGKIHDRFYTPAHIMGQWREKLDPAQEDGVVETFAGALEIRPKLRMQAYR